MPSWSAAPFDCGEEIVAELKKIPRFGENRP
jgi:hypothetical protein